MSDIKYSDRKYLPTLSELLDRLSILQIKELKIHEHKDEYASEICDIVHDIQLILNESNINISAEMIRAIVVLSQMNLHIWQNESSAREGNFDSCNLRLTHGLNGIRNTAKNVIQEFVGGRKDYKIDCLASEFNDWQVSWPVSDAKQKADLRVKNDDLDYVHILDRMPVTRALLCGGDRKRGRI